MACTGHSNVPNGVPCTGHVTPVSPVDWVDPVPQSIDISAAQFNQLRAAVNDELSRRSTAYIIPTVVIGEDVKADDWREIRNGINACQAWTFPATVDNTAINLGADIKADAIITMRNKTDSLRSDCVCNCNYACTCDCNYPCTCNCNYSCTCDCNYACTCNCNYSDKRLKIDIEYI